jgi:hypothetical protein
LAVSILGANTDPRMSTVREALTHWNAELARLGRRVQVDSGTIRAKTVGEDVLRAASDGVLAGGGPAVDALRASLAGVPGEIVIVLSDSDLVSYALTQRADAPGIVVLRRSDIQPLSLPNVLRNVVAHEIGHVFGLVHNPDALTLMCGRPASCRPDAFASNTPRFFPLTPADEQLLRQRFP